jgi:uncharacterized membrane protein HdeD (DUF308 family)
MSIYNEREHVPKWRLILYGVLTTAIFTALGLYVDNRGIVIASVFCGVFIVGFGFVLDAARTNTSPNWLRSARWLIYIGLFLAIAQKLFPFLQP